MTEQREIGKGFFSTKVVNGNDFVNFPAPLQKKPSGQF
jgi:hypothetical protein